MECKNFVDRLSAYAALVLQAESLPENVEFNAAVRQLQCAVSADTIALMDRFIRTAHDRMPSSDAAFHWRMVYIDASVLKALACASLSLQEDTIRGCISTLDHAIIIAGAAGDDDRRDYVVHDVIKLLQSALSWRPTSSAVFVAKPAPPAPHPLPTSRNSVRTFAALPSVTSADKRWSRAPFVVRACADDWPATHRWPSLSYLSSVAGPGRVVPVEVGDDYRDDDWSQKLLGWEEFLASLDPSAAPVHRLYLAQHNLLMQFPAMRQDIIIPDLVYACLDSCDFPAYEPPANVMLNAWFGPTGTISPAHTDPFFNCYVQVVGRKTVWLAPPRIATAMYPAEGPHHPAANTASPSLSNTSRVDVFSTTVAASQKAFPLFWDTAVAEAACVTLSPGDLLFFPPGWWHAMRSEDVSFSVSMWF